VDREHILGIVIELARSVDDKLRGLTLRLDDTPLTSYGLTSLAMLQLIARVEDRFGVAISDAEALRAGTALSLVDLIQAKVAPAGSGAT
jgi:acyl carrier protein